MKKGFIIILVSILLFSCSDKTQNTIQNIWEDYSFNTTISNSTQIIIKSYDSTLANKRVNVEAYIPSKIYRARTKKQLEEFDKIFLNTEKTDYCCCPKNSYSIHFLNKKEELDYFYVDTIEFKNKVRICEKSYQFSYIINKQNWKDYLNELEKNNQNDRN
ncbi:hypothetical protein [Flavobacterium sp. SLB02]|uniref:hypothetical protein n=1 Tax=Flavobacterium sp. SLB02 TaxID=2665645 RepID=UPI0012A8786B|nr:hypothetical protein [Flavobacterium sp. SLB02]QGK75069.1 hypothetical protein GIY83_13605 [Flavobacterium sp. SLB02]